MMKQIALLVFLFGFLILLSNAIFAATPSDVCVRNISNSVVWIGVEDQPTTLLTNTQEQPYTVAATWEKTAINIECCLSEDQKTCLKDIYCYAPGPAEEIDLRPGELLYISDATSGATKKFSYTIRDAACPQN